MLQSDRRRADRKSTLKKGKIIFNNAMCVVECTIKDLSTTGAGLELPLWQDLPEDFSLVISGGPTRTCEVAWAASNRLGVHFVDSQQPAPEQRQVADRSDYGSLLARLDDLQRQLDSLREEIKARA